MKKNIALLIIIVLLITPVVYADDLTDFEKAVENRQKFIAENGPVTIDTHGVLSFNINDYYYDENLEGILIFYETTFKGFYYSYGDRNFTPSPVVFVDEMDAGASVELINQDILSEEETEGNNRTWNEKQEVKLFISHPKDELFQKEIIVGLYRTNGESLNILLEEYENIQVNYIPGDLQDKAEQDKAAIEGGIDELNEKEKDLEKEENSIVNIIKYLAVAGGSIAVFKKLLDVVQKKRKKVKKSKQELEGFKRIIDQELLHVKKEKGILRKMFDDIQTMGGHVNKVTKKILKPINHLENIKLPIVDVITVGDLVSLTGTGAIKDILKVKNITEKILKLKFGDIKESTIHLFNEQLNELYQHKKVNNTVKEYDKAKSLLEGSKEALKTSVDGPLDLIEASDRFEAGRRDTQSIRKKLEQSQEKLAKNINTIGQQVFR